MCVRVFFSGWDLYDTCPLAHAHINCGVGSVCHCPLAQRFVTAKVGTTVVSVGDLLTITTVDRDVSDVCTVSFIEWDHVTARVWREFCADAFHDKGTPAF